MNVISMEKSSKTFKREFSASFLPPGILTKVYDEGQ